MTARCLKMGKNNKETYNYAKQFKGKGGAIFRKYCGLPGGTAYCNAYVTYIFHHTGNASLYCGGKKQTYCPTSIKWCQKNLAQIPLYLAMPMDIIYFDWDRNRVPNHIGFVKAKKSTSEIYTHEGNTNGGIVAEKTRPAKYICGIFRPHFKGAYKLAKLAVDGDCGYNTIASLQKLVGAGVDAVLGLNTVKKVQTYFGTKADGAWGAGTSRAIQGKLAKAGYYTGKIDGEFGKVSVMGLQKYINAKLYSTSQKKPITATKPTKPTTTTTKPKSTLKSYRIDIDLTNQIATVYGIYSDKSAKVLMSEFVSTARKGKTTPTGNFKIQGASGGRKAKYRTCKLSGGKTYAEYACRFKGAKMMHGVPYKTRNTKGYVYKGEFNKLGSVASGGCVRMPIKLARYIYNNCPVGTPVHVFKGTKGKYPAGKPKKYTATQNIDPTR